MIEYGSVPIKLCLQNPMTVGIWLMDCSLPIPALELQSHESTKNEFVLGWAGGVSDFFFFFLTKEDAIKARCEQLVEHN